MPNKQNRFTLQFSGSDQEAWEWFCAQTDKGAYIKALLLADKARQEQGESQPDIVTRDDRLEAEWDKRLALCVEFAHEFGRLPMYNENYRGIKIGRWLDVHKKRCIEENRDDRREKLCAIGAFDGKWERNYRLLVAFRDEKGRFPKSTESYCGVKLGQWLERQRKEFAAKEELTPQMERLCAIGALMDGWDRRFAMALGFIKKHGRTPEYGESYKGYRIGRWLYDQGKAIDPAKHPERAQKLRSVGILPEDGGCDTAGDTEKCVCCGIDTGVPRDLHISHRQCYIEGAGQLCANCYRSMSE